MPTQMKGITTYKCDKTEISGDPKEVRDLIKYEQKAKMDRWKIKVTIIAVTLITGIMLLPKENILPFLLKYAKLLLPFLSLYALIFLSG